MCQTTVSTTVSHLVQEAEHKRSVCQHRLLLRRAQFVAQELVADALEPLERVKEVAVFADRHNVVRRNCTDRLVAQSATSHERQTVVTCESDVTTCH